MTTMDVQKIRLDSAAFSDRGRKRDLNQDMVFHQSGQTENGETIGLFLVCDGMGGHQAGEIASHIAVETISMALSPMFVSSGLEAQKKADESYLTISQRVEEAVTKANADIRRYAKNHPRKASKLGTTVSLALIRGHLAHIVNVGDCRVYGWRDNTLTQITQDHSMAAKLVEKQVIEEKDLPRHSSRNLIYRALGLRDEIEIDVFDWGLEPGDKLLLCSDGLWKAFSNGDDLSRWVGIDATSADLCQQLVNEAKNRDGSDNISAIVITVNQDVEC